MINQTEQTCPTVAYQMSSVCVPVKVTPFARTGATFTKCCGTKKYTNLFLMQIQNAKPPLGAAVLRQKACGAQCSLRAAGFFRL